MTVKITNLAKLDALQAVPQAIMVSLGRNLADMARAEWVRLAVSGPDHLNSTALDYVHGVTPVKLTTTGFYVELVGAWPNMLEHGASSFDMRTTLLADGKNWKESSAGHRYRSIPFRHKVPGSTSRGGQVMGSAYKNHEAVSDWKKLGKNIHKAAKKLRSGGLDTSKMGIPKLKGHHTADIYSGMKKNRQAVTGPRGGVSYQNTYTTFRTISTNPESAGWIHPGIQAKNYAEDVHKFIEEQVPAVIDHVLEGIFSA